MTTASAAALTTVIFDLGGVVLKWEPERAYQRVLPADQVAEFMAEIDFWTWNRLQDAGGGFDVGEQDLIDRFPDSSDAIRAYRLHFDEALTGMVDGTGAVIAELAQAGVRLIALTNWSAETFPRALSRFAMLNRFEGIVVSGTERLAKPDPAIFELVCRRYRLDPARCVFVDDSAANIEAARRLGITALDFSDAVTLRTDFVKLGLLGERAGLKRPIFHITEASLWHAALRAGEFPWSTRNLTYDREGFVHCSFAEQVTGVAERAYADVDRADLVVLELDPALLRVPVVVEDLGTGTPYPHIYAPLPMASVIAVRAL